MKIRIIHYTEYNYSSEVFFEPHYLRLKPKYTSYCSLESFKIDVSPVPAGISEFMDPENNQVHFCWFENLHRRLTIKTDTTINFSDFNPFNFIIYPDEFNHIPFEYPNHLIEILSPALQYGAISNDVVNYLEKFKRKFNLNSLEFILNLTREIWKDFNLELRMEGPPHKPDKTLNLKRGSCRDLAWFQIQLLRYVGIAARFTSGYYFIPMDKPEYELHAWLEVYLPGAGWIGFDPSHGIVSGNDHFPIASSSDFRNTLPVIGSVRGDAKSELKTDLLIEILD